jgi:rod shape determining protein RodA
MYRPWYVRINKVILSITVVLILFGMLMIYSATFRDAGFGDVKRQFFALVVGLFLAGLVFFFDYKRICGYTFSLGKLPFKLRISYLIYGVSVFLLLLVLVKGHSAYGSQRWIRVGPFGTFEPSEFAKLAVILVLASFFSTQEKPIHLKSFVISAVLTGIPLLLVLVQPDLGTSIVIASIFVFYIYFMGMNPAWLAGLVAGAIAVMFKIMKPYQRERLLVFLHPNQDPTGGGWNLIQSLIAVGSGKLVGKGLFAGTQTQLKFVPQHSTDFIFTVVAEELGFLGCVLLLILYFFLLWYGTKIALETEDLLGRLLASGIVVMFFLHIVIITGIVGIAFLLNIEYCRDRLLP